VPESTSWHCSPWRR